MYRLNASHGHLVPSIRVPRGRAAILLALAFMAGCAHEPPAKTPAAQEAPNLGVLKLQYTQGQNRKLVESQIAAVFAEASRYVQERAPAVTRPAVVLDIDETSIDNWKQLVANDFGYIRNGDAKNGDCSYLPQGPCSSLTWDSLNQAPAEPGAVEFFDSARADHVSVFFITGRRERERAATIAQLNAAGFKDWEGLSLKGADMPTARYKTLERVKIEGAGYTIIANLGDQPSDLTGGHAERVFRVPNPYYFIP